MNRTALTALVVITTIGVAHALYAPTVKEGFWKVHVVTRSGSGPASDGSYSMCRNHAYDDYARQFAENAAKACTISESTQGNKHLSTSVCKSPGTTITSNTVLTMVSDSNYKIEVNSTYSPALNGMTQESTAIEQTYAGSCPAGVGPGDRVLPDGTVRHLWRH